MVTTTPMNMLIAVTCLLAASIASGIVERTVKAHIAKMMRKVGVHTRIELSVHAVARSLVSLPANFPHAHRGQSELDLKPHSPCGR
jgi:hypothetical protein